MSNLNTLTPEQKYRQDKQQGLRARRSQLKYFWYAHGSSVRTQVRMAGRVAHSRVKITLHLTHTYARNSYHLASKMGIADIVYQIEER